MSLTPEGLPRPGLDVDVRGGSFHLPPGFVVWREIEGRWQRRRASDGETPGVELHARYDDELHRYRVERFVLRGADVTTALIRTIPLQRYLRELIAEACERPDPESIMLFFDLDVLAYWYPERHYGADELVHRRQIERSERSISNT